ncbi:hypothetical protein EDD28_3007 [Salana multivorans]|uniref:Uncharacterized protein n=1 Tax=Salana multivorans TaxID=120377 RepID=A0A3N2D1D3_9MICO|nr:hypothetical protein [Salana multivorans]MBN8881761.1 hypothetical protein [Salana multivorans]OJX94364.1 MAG: hypothetical protein BGO96_15820 [Micrococcales bacterium 73-15]ROR93589.1 hypothetical protein EDD28_3007 [Salana multivorans]
MAAVVVILALLVSSVLGIVLVPAVLRLAPAKEVPRARAADLLRGGLVIGILERFAITGALIVGRPEAVGVVLAIKGLGRYPELRNAATAAGEAPRGEEAGPGAAPPVDPAIGAAVSERFIIGTLASYLWAGVCGVVAVWTLAHVG